MIKKLFPTALYPLLCCGCSSAWYNVSLEPQILTNGDIVYRYADVISLARPANEETEKIRLAYLDEWMNNSKNCSNGYDIIKREVVSTNTTYDSKRVFYFIRCK